MALRLIVVSRVSAGNSRLNWTRKRAYQPAGAPERIEQCQPMHIDVISKRNAAAEIDSLRERIVWLGVEEISAYAPEDRVHLCDFFIGGIVLFLHFLLLCTQQSP